MAPSRPPRPPARPARDPKDLLKKRGADLIRKVSDKDRYAIFLEPVDVGQVNGYTDVIARPMDLSTAQKNLQMGVYRTPMELRADLDLIWSNCCTFNDDESIYFKEAVRLRTLAARYYDDLIRALSRDGVAAALGISTPRINGPAPSRHAQKRPPRSRFTPPLSLSHTPAASPSPHTSELESSEVDVDQSGSASASATASAAQLLTFRDTQIRRAHTARDAAVAAATAAAEEVRAASAAAGIPPPGPVSHAQIFAGPAGILKNPSHSGMALPAKEYPVASNPHIRDRCSEIPSSWKRVGRWHSRGATLSKFLSRDRAVHLRFGRQYEKFVQKSAPVARRLLATVLDPQVVQLQDMCTLAQVDPPKHPAMSGLTQDGSSVVPTSHESSDSYLSVPKVDGLENGNHSAPQMNGVHIGMEIDIEDCTDAAAKESMEIGPKTPRRPRSNPKQKPLIPNSTRPVNGRRNSLVGERPATGGFKDLVRRNGEQMPPNPENLPSEKSLASLRELLDKHGIDASFIGGLSRNAKHNAKDSLGWKTGAPLVENITPRGDPLTKEPDNGLTDLLNSNHSTIMNVLRIRALRENASEALDEDLESQEREYVESLSAGVSLAVRRVPPKVVVHPADVAETAIEMSRSVLPPQQKPVPK